MTLIIPLSRFKIFIVDDSAVIVERLIALLSDLKNVTIVGNACNIFKALPAINELKPNLVILDIHLKDDAPHANGIDLLVILRKTYPALLIMMLTNLATPEYNKKCMESGADYFFDKSNDFDKIPEILKKLAESF